MRRRVSYHFQEAWDRRCQTPFWKSIQQACYKLNATLFAHVFLNPPILLLWFDLAFTSSALLGGYKLTAGACRLAAQTATTRQPQRIETRSLGHVECQATAGPICEPTKEAGFWPVRPSKFLFLFQRLSWIRSHYWVALTIKFETSVVLHWSRGTFRSFSVQGGEVQAGMVELI